jgi:hypothetical protein
MRSWIHWINTRAKKLDMLRSILDTSVGFLDSSYQRLCEVDRQSRESNQSDKSTQCDKSTESHECTSHSNRSCNCADGQCADSESTSTYFGQRRSEVSGSFNDNEFYNIYARGKDGSAKGKRNSAWVWDCYEHATIDSSIHDTEPTDHRSNQHGARE